MMLVLSLFPGIGLLDMAFEEHGFCVVRGPDLLWGGDVKRFRPPAGRFDGVIGGPPCQGFSVFRNLYEQTGGQPTHGNLIPEFERCVDEAEPQWFLMENVPDAPEPAVCNYSTTSIILNNRWVGGVSNRRRRFTFGIRDGAAPDLGRFVEVEALEQVEWLPAALASGGLKPGTEKERRRRRGNEYGYNTKYTVRVALEAQGLPPTFLEHSPMTVEGQHRVLGNGVPLPMGRAIAAAVKAAIADRGVT